MASFEPSIQVQRAVSLLQKHRYVLSARIVEVDGKIGLTRVAVELPVELPSGWVAQRQSPNGVRSVETVTFNFSTAYPLRAPLITLRDDFNRSLPHIYPGSAPGPVRPCIYDGDLSELLQQGGIWAIVDHLCHWLDNAATDSLIESRQGWEPIRRDEVGDWIVANAGDLQHFGDQKGHPFHVFRDVWFILMPRIEEPASRRFFYGDIGPNVKVTETLEGFSIRTDDKKSVGHSIGVIVHPGKNKSASPFVTDVYVPDSVRTAEDLANAAQQYGCERGLSSALGRLRYCLSASPAKEKLPLVIVFCARRPFQVIGTGSRIELVPYLTELRACFDKTTTVYPLSHRDSVEIDLLRRLSGTDDKARERKQLVQLGCGSLGSKIAVHLARGGDGPTCIADFAFLKPHHAARHALLPRQRDSDGTWAGSKAEAVAEVLGGLGQTPKVVDQDIRLIRPESEHFRSLFPKNLWAVVNSTASLAVRERLSSISPDILPARVIETSLWGTSRAGLITVEGSGRNPSSTDLTANAYLLLSEDETLRQSVLACKDQIGRQLVGQGCGSATMVISDMRISLFAASMAQAINSMQREGLPIDGKIWLGAISTDGMNLNWMEYTLAPTKIVKVDNADGWTLRILPRAQSKIAAECLHYPVVETGGIMTGFVSEVQRAVTIADVIPAPCDSIRSAEKFVLGVKGVNRILERYVELTGGSLYCVGTWHSHLLQQGPSPTDYATGELIADLNPFPLAMLVKTPSGFRGLVTNARGSDGSIEHNFAS
jgi:hypothetical protein